MKNFLDIKYEKYTLSNGLEVILYQDKSIPLVSANIWYKVGSANELPNKTGFAHLFEHMMFQGSQNVPKEKHFRFIQEAGGTLNGSTSFDRTNYFETVPSNNLELILWLESDRMGFLLPALTEEKLKNQKDVVMNERRQRYDNQPYGLAWEKLFSNLFPQNHPYSWPTIGWMKDIEKFEINDVRHFFEKYYVPNNASLVIGGDFEIAEAKSLVEKYFSEIPSGKDIKSIIYEDPQLSENKFLSYEDNIQLPRLYLGWHSDKLFGKDDAALDIISDVLSGSKNSRLYKSLVFDKQIAQDVVAFQYSAKLNGSFYIIATPKENVSLDLIKEEIFNSLKEIIQNEITDKELERSLNTLKSTFIYSLQKQMGLVDQINAYNCYLNEPNSFIYDLNRYEILTKTDIKNAAEKYLTKNFVELRIIPKDQNG